ncbi:MAG TPA: MaoC family dehydratase [Chloroflexota bacterium]|nr:MaoC family dehydratase [Chloroflexota bacterium]
MADRTRSPMPGEILGPLEVLVSAERVRAYAEASGDHNPIHLDPAFAAGTHFGGAIAHGMLLLAYLSRLMSGRFGRAWVENGSLDARFRGPAMVGAPVRVLGSVQSVAEAPEGLLVQCALRCEDENGHILVQAAARVLIA